MTDSILQFRGEYRWLSNFWPCVVLHGEHTYPTVENAYQAAKTFDQGMRRIMQKVSPGESKRMGQNVKLREDWERVKDSVMLNLLRQKFKDNPELREKLLTTEDAVITEGNTWGDTYWGVDLATGVGLNKLGILIMQVRDEIRMGVFP